MKIQISVTERVNLGNFEFTEISGSVEFDDSEAGRDPAGFAQEQLDVLLLSHRRRAQELLSEDSDSFMNYHPALQED